MTRVRVRRWIEARIDRWDEVVYQRDWPTWAYVPEVGFLGHFARASCRLRGHVPTADDCGIASHDYCAVCYERVGRG